MSGNKGGNNGQNYYELYRRSSIGEQLTASLDTLIQSGHINPLLAIRVLNQFDRSIAETLSAKVKSKATVKGHLRNYNSCDEVWTFNVQGGKVKLDNGEEIEVDRLKIVACKMAEGGTSK
ncbi:transcription initiation factor IIA, gamma subunit [Microstroma glucosiphilum]|uniref:Transcription initiation factor IIA subunit 2 n=1 Tax=Pseudomicrostroma glucosiphilum TaxID=1684307 RepID=A0A316U2S0_9BASI|nr:transcription initiation factor IIA, gamma subunit [Pseudomicrostroma glucosiphilum]PWN18791.1 transcription initiation factor IIA, gamma subunit [Pseudomicrostroma glucosiphilum]